MNNNKDSNKNLHTKKNVTASNFQEYVDYFALSTSTVDMVDG